MIKERRSKPRPDHGVARMTSSELDAAIRELNEKVQLLMAERQLRQKTKFSALKTDQVDGDQSGAI